MSVLADHFAALMSTMRRRRVTERMRETLAAHRLNAKARNLTHCADGIHAINGYPNKGEVAECVYCGAALTVGERV